MYEGCITDVLRVNGGIGPAVRPCATSLSDCRMPTSVAVSSAEVASSASSRRGARRKARAMATL